MASVNKMVFTQILVQSRFLLLSSTETVYEAINSLYVNFPFFGTHPTFFFKKLHFVYPKY